MMIAPQQGGLSISFSSEFDTATRIDLIWAFLYGFLPFEQAAQCAVRVNEKIGAIDIDISDGRRALEVQCALMDRSWKDWDPNKGVTRLRGDAYCRLTEPAAVGVWN